MKRKIMLLLLAVSFAVLWSDVRRLQNDPKLSSRVADEESLLYSMSKLMLVEAQAPDIYFDGEKLFYDPGSHTYYYSLVEGSSSAFDPRVRLITVRENARVAFTSGITQELIESNTPILFSVYNDVGYELFYLCCTTLPLLNVDCESEYIGSSADEPMDITLFDNREGAPRRLVESEGLIHKRGGSSAAFPKIGYKISLKKDSVGGSRRNNTVSLLGMRQDDDWILYAGYSDTEKIRNVFSQNLWYESCRYDNEQKRSTGTQYKYVEMFLNGEYNGLYALCYPIDEKELKLCGDRSIQALYKYTNFMGDTIEVNGYGRIGGIEVKYPGSGWDPSDELAAYGQPVDSGDFDLLFRYLDFLNSHRSDNGALLYGIDLQNALDMTLFLNLTQGEDQVGTDNMKNVYLALFKEKEGIKGLLIPWDLDVTWGCSWEEFYKNNVKSYVYTPEDNFILNCGYFAQMIKNDEAIYDRLLSEKYKRLREGAWSDERIMGMLDGYEAQIFDSGAFLRDMERWPDGNYGSPQNKLSVFKDYVLRRLEYCDSFYGIR